MKISIGDVSLWFDVDGPALVPDGSAMLERPTIILLHGGPGFDHSVLKPDFQALADDAQLVMPDQRGHGRSDAGDPRSWTLDRWADDVAAFCRSLSITRPILLGQSFGGFVALAAAIRHPGLMAGIVTIGGTAHVERDAAVARFAERGGAEAAAAAKAIFSRPENDAALAEFTRLCFPLYGGGGMDPARMARAMITRDVMNRFFRPDGEYGRFDYRDALRSCHVPTLMLHGQLDPIIPVEFARSTAAAFPSGVARLVIYDDCAHDVVGDRRADVLSEVRHFLSRLAAAGVP